MYKRGQNVYRVRSQICLWHGRGTSCRGRDCKFLLRPCRRTAAQDSAERWNYFTLFHNASVSRSTNVQMLSGAALPAGLHWTVGAEGWGWARHMALSTGECECGLASILHHSCAVLENAEAAEAWGGWDWRSQVPFFFSGQSPWSCTWTEVLQKQPYHHRQWHHDSGKAKTERHREKWHEMANICKYKYVSSNIIELQVCAVICHVFKDVATRKFVYIHLWYPVVPRVDSQGLDPPGAAMMDLVPMHLLVWLFEIFTKDTELNTCFALFCQVRLQSRFLRHDMSTGRPLVRDTFNFEIDVMRPCAITMPRRRLGRAKYTGFSLE